MTAGLTSACICGCCGPTPVALADEWDYRAKGKTWGGTCGTGQYQSPIDFRFTTDQPQTFFASNAAGNNAGKNSANQVMRVVPNFGETECVITNAGHGTMQVRMSRV